MKTIDTKSVIIGLLFGVCVMLLMGQAKEKAKSDISGIHDVIKTKQLQIINDKGKRAVVLSYDKGEGGSISILNADEEFFGSISALRSGGYIELRGKGGKNSAVTIGSNTHGGYMKGFDNNAKENSFVGAGALGGEIAIWNNTGEPVVQIRTDKNGEGLVGAYNRRGRGNELKPAM